MDIGVLKSYKKRTMQTMTMQFRSRGSCTPGAEGGDRHAVIRG